MSTRGYLTILDADKKIAMSAYHGSDSYPSYLGLQVLDAIESDTFPQFIDQIRNTYPDDLEMVEGIRRSWYVKSKENENDFFQDYAYEYEIDKQRLNIFHFGTKALTITRDQIPLFRYLFEQEDTLYYPLTLDDKTQTLSKDFYKELRSMIRSGSTIQDFQSIIEKNPSVLYMSIGRIVDLGCNSNDFIKEVCVSDSHQRLKFCASEYFGKYSLYVQTPFYRGPVSTPPLRSKSAVEKYIASLIKNSPQDIRGTMALYQDINDYIQKIKSIYAEDNIDLNTRAQQAGAQRHVMVERIEDTAGQFYILGAPKDSLIRQVKEVEYRYRRDAQERAKPSAALDALVQNASARVDKQPSTHKEPPSKEPTH